MNKFIDSLKINITDEQFTELFNYFINNNNNEKVFTVRKSDKNIILITHVDASLVSVLFFKLNLMLVEYEEYSIKPIVILDNVSYIEISGFNSLEEFYSMLKLIQ